MKKQFVSLLCAAALICSGFCTIPGSEIRAFAEEIANSGTCGENITWELDDDGLLTISGTGPMTNFGAFGAPYNKLRSKILSVSVSDGITSIGSWAFSACNITEIVLPDSIETIGESAFEACGSLASVHFPAKLKTVGPRAFTQCSKLTEVALPDTVTALGTYAFGRCPMKTFVIPPHVTSLGGSLFDSCWALEEITIPESVTDFGPSVFLRTPWLEAKQAEDPLVIVNNVVVDGKKCTGNVVIPDTVTAITEQCFYGCGGMTGIELNKNITEIPIFAFEECGLKEITLPGTVTHIAKQAFWGCGNLEKVTILNPDCVIETEDDSKTFPYDTAICGYEGSTAQAYAKFRRDFISLGEAPAYDLGDVNRDGEISLADAVMLQKYLITESILSEASAALADMDSNGILNAADLTLLKRIVLYGNHASDGLTATMLVTSKYDTGKVFTTEFTVKEGDVFFESEKGIWRQNANEQIAAPHSKLVEIKSITDTGVTYLNYTWGAQILEWTNAYGEQSDVINSTEYFIVYDGYNYSYRVTFSAED